MAYYKVPLEEIYLKESSEVTSRVYPGDFGGYYMLLEDKTEVSFPAEGFTLRKTTYKEVVTRKTVMVDDEAFPIFMANYRGIAINSIEDYAIYKEEVRKYLSDISENGFSK